VAPKFEGGLRDPATGKRRTQFVTFRGTKAEANVKLAKLVAAVGGGTYVEPSKVSVAEHVRARVARWKAAYDPGAVTISKRLGHAKPDITLRIYAHLFTKADIKAADAINAALNGLGAS
jgi:integrase